MIKFKSLIRDDRGSLSLLILSHFMLTIITVAILTNISSVYLAKRALTQGTEAATQRGVRNLDLDSYYRGEFNISRFALNLLGSGQKDPGIPIDCTKGRADVIQAISHWVQLANSNVYSHGRTNLRNIDVNEVTCDGYQITVSTSAQIKLPFVLPFIDTREVLITSRVSSITERKVTTNYYVINIG